MKYLFKTLLTLIIIFFSIKFLFFLFDDGHQIGYNVKNFHVKETLQTKENNNYYFELTNDKLKINFQINKNYKKAEKIITKIYHKKIDSYQCVLPVFKGNTILTDVMCLNKNTITYAHDINNKQVQKYVKNLKQKNYDINNYNDQAKAKKLSNSQTIYEDNLLENHYIAMETYKGLNLFNNTIGSVKIFDEDVYKKPLSVFTGKYYLVADYKEKYSFKNFTLINIINGNKTNIRSYDDISFDSYIQGVVDDDIYLFDKDAQTQYKISIKYESVEKVADKNNLKYYNGKWMTMSLSDALNNKKFNNNYSDKIKGYDKVDKIGDKTGYYYLYKKQNNKYQVFKADIQNPKLKTYLFETTSLDSIIYLDDVIYYLNGNCFYYYTNNGSRKILSNSELEFNNDISFGVYKK